jgi:hypothetical protein
LKKTNILKRDDLVTWRVTCDSRHLKSLLAYNEHMNLASCFEIQINMQDMNRIYTEGDAK